MVNVSVLLLIVTNTKDAFLIGNANMFIVMVGNDHNRLSCTFISSKVDRLDLIIW